MHIVASLLVPALIQITPWIVGRPVLETAG
jgi:hypothetical protein